MRKVMAWMFLLICVFSCLTLTSCGDNDEETGTNNMCSAVQDKCD